MKLALLVLSFLSLSVSAAPLDVPAILRDRVAARKATVGIVAAVVTPEGVSYFSQGSAARGGSSVDEGTQFRIASVTKVFTTLLLADMVERGDVAFDDPVSKYLPTAKVPSRHGREITLRHLATHTSGLPGMPSNYSDRRPYTDAELYDFLARCALASDPGSRYSYSNLGMALLGHALAVRSGKTYEQLLTERITGPLDLTGTSVRVTAANGRLASGHDRRLRSTRFHPSEEGFAGASEIVSNARDLARLMSVAISTTDGPLRSAIQRTRHPLQSRDGYNTHIALGWFVDNHLGRTIVWHGGESRDGYSSFVGFDPDRRIAAVVLSNSRTPVSDIGFHLLDQRFRLDPQGDPSLIPLDETMLDEFVGRYEVQPSYVIVVQKKGTRLTGHAHARPRELLPVDHDAFRIRGLPATLSFVRDERGAIASVILNADGRMLEGRKVGGL